MPAPLQTPLHAWHAAHGGRMVEFGGWSMPVQYTSIVEEHRAVRTRAGLFDISHMGRINFEGDALPWLESVTTNEVARLKPGQIQYSLMPNERGGLIDDVLVYRRADGGYAMVCNASNRENVLAQLEARRGGRDARLVDQTRERAMIALQGPRAISILGTLASVDLNSILYYHSCEGTILGVPALYSRTGYTGEDGFELIVASAEATRVWEALLEAGGGAVLPCGLGARDTLRFEAAMPLYGHELGPEIDPYEAGLGWAVKLGKGDFVGRAAIQARKSKRSRARVGLELGGKRIAREGAPVLNEAGERVGEVTSGTFAPTLEKSLAMAYVRKELAEVGTLVVVEIRGHREGARVVPLPFYRRPEG